MKLESKALVAIGHRAGDWQARAISTASMSSAPSPATPLFLS